MLAISKAQTARSCCTNHFRRISVRARSLDEAALTKYGQKSDDKSGETIGEGRIAHCGMQYVQRGLPESLGVGGWVGKDWGRI